MDGKRSLEDSTINNGLKILEKLRKTKSLYMMNKSITQPFTQEYFFRHAYFKMSQFWEVLIFEPVLIIENIRDFTETRIKNIILKTC